jgi:hypothetical protein
MPPLLYHKNFRFKTNASGRRRRPEKRPLVAVPEEAADYHDNNEYPQHIVPVRKAILTAHESLSL